MGFWGSLFGTETQTKSAPAVQPAGQTAPVRLSAFDEDSAGIGGGNWLNGIGTRRDVRPAELAVYSPKGVPLRLTDNDLLSDGGEGYVYVMPNRSDIVLKIYREHIRRDSQKIAELNQRISDMVHLGDRVGKSCFAWPRMLVLNERKEAIGFAMNRCSGQPLSSLDIRAIQKKFPHWTRVHLVLTGIDFLKKLEFLVQNEVIVNDFNPANFLVNENCSVSFIDCDSYQVPHPGGGVNITHTYFASYVAPELLRDRKLLTLPRNHTHVEFGAALVLFRLLMCGLHPYSYYDIKHNCACGTPDQNLLNGRSPLGYQSKCLFPEGPWYNMWSQFTYDLKNSFIQTFKPGHADPAQRVSLSRFRNDLEKMLYVMKRDPARCVLVPAEAKSREDKRKQGAAEASCENF